MARVIIIGSGLGGLTAGNLLAAQGHKVTIFESHSAPGGYTAGFRRNGYYFESGTFSLECSDLIFRVMKDIGIDGKVEFVRQVSRLRSEDFDAIPESYAELKEMFYKSYPAEKQALDRFFGEVDKLVAATEPFLLKSDGWAKLAGSLKMLGLYNKYRNVTMGQFMNKYFAEDSNLYRFWTRMVYPDTAAWMIGGAIVSFISDYWTVKGGMQSWADALADNFRAAGGELRLNTCIDRIVTDKGKATGVAKGQDVWPADYVIAAGDYKQTFLKLLDDQSLVPTALLRKIERSAVSEGFMVVYLGLRMTNEELGKIMKVPHLTFFDEKQGLDIYDEEDECFFQKNSIGLYSLSLLNPALAPAGKSSLMIAAMASPDWMDNWGGGDKRRYLALKEKAKKDMIDKAGKVIPGLRGLIEYEDAATPLTYERFTHNTGGATSAWSWNPEKKFYDNAMGNHVDTPVKNLFIGSCWAAQMGGVPGAVAAALKCVKRIK
jgi:phytoene dehydrogenase-like protein